MVGFKKTELNKYNFCTFYKGPMVFSLDLPTPDQFLNSAVNADHS